MSIPYGKTNDFFFSGHVGCCIINFLEFRANSWYKFSWFSMVTCILQFSLMVCLRGHYFIDLVSGIIFAHYAWMLSERYSYVVDVKIFNIPLKKRFHSYTHSCSKCQHPNGLWIERQETAYIESNHFGEVDKIIGEASDKERQYQRINRTSL